MNRVMRQLGRPWLGSLKARLTALSIALGGGLILILALLVATVYSVERRASQTQLLATARALSLAVDGRMLAGQAELQALATSESLQNNDVIAFDRRARRLGPSPDAWFILYDLSGRQLVNTAVPLGTPSPVWRSRDLGERIAKALAQGAGFSGLHFGRRANQPLVSIDELVRTAAGTPFILSLSVSPRSFARVFGAQKLPAGWNCSLVDAHGLIIARNGATDRFVGRRVTEPAARAMARGPEGVVDSVSQTGRPTLLAFTRSSLTGWSLLVGLPEGEAALPIDRTIALLGPLILVLIALGALAVFLTLRRVGLNLQTLGAVAMRVGRGEAVEPPTTGMLETDAIGQVLHGASLQLRAREADLRAAAASLEQRVAERTAELEATHSQLAQSQKLEAIGQLTGGVAHDFNNLLTIIRSSVDFLRRDDLTPSRRARYVEAISDTAERATKLTGHLLAFARRQPLKPEVFDVGQRVRAVADLVQPLVGSGIATVCRLGETPLFVSADANQFETALVNLAVNARDAMNGEGRLTFDVRRDGSGHLVSISVADTGVGIAPEALQRIFEPFYTTKDVGKGTGLGLSQVIGFAKQSGGEVEVTSAPGEGSTFTISLPAQAPVEQGHDPPEVATRLRPLCVLVVDDNEAVGRFATEILQDLGHDTVWASDAAEALTILERGEARFDVVLTDVVMPGMSGIELATTIGRVYPLLPVVLTSGYSQALAEDGLQGRTLLRKPYSIETLAAALQNAPVQGANSL